MLFVEQVSLSCNMLQTFHAFDFCRSYENGLNEKEDGGREKEDGGRESRSYSRASTSKRRDDSWDEKWSNQVHICKHNFDRSSFPFPFLEVRSCNHPTWKIFFFNVEQQYHVV